MPVKAYREPLDEAIEQALERTCPFPEAAEKIIDSQEPWIIPLAPVWAIQKLTRLLRQEWAARSRELQPVLPGFEDLATSIPRRRGGRVKLLDATLEDLVQYRKWLYQRWRGTKRHAQLDRLIALMKKRKVHAIKVSEVLRLEGIEPHLPS